MFLHLLALSTLLLGSLTSSQADESVTYPGLGTFHKHDFFDVTKRPVAVLPASPDKIQAKFTLFTPANKESGHGLSWDSAKPVEGTHFDASLETKVVVHGFLDKQLLDQWMVRIKDAFLLHQQVNVILVDWSKGNFFPYFQAAVNTRVVGAMIGKLIQNICHSRNLQPSQFHVLGHSLGSHVSGYAGKFLNGSLGHITGLDPAGPYFEGIPKEGRLWHTDALFVESIHTDASPLIPRLGFGMQETCSHVDFYPNGGQLQPGCDQNDQTRLILGIAQEVRNFVSCNHQMSVDYYVDTLLNGDRIPPQGILCSDYDSYLAGKCTDCGPSGTNCALMGQAIDLWRKSVNGVYGNGGKRFFLRTAPKAPFFRYNYAVHIKMSPERSGLIPQHGKIQLELKGNGQSVLFDFNTKKQLFHFGSTYRSEFITTTNLGQLDAVKFSWVHGIDLLYRGKMNVDSVEVIRLTGRSLVGTKEERAFGVHFKFCSDGQGISNREEYEFKNTC